MLWFGFPGLLPGEGGALSCSLRSFITPFLCLLYPLFSVLGVSILFLFIFCDAYCDVQVAVKKLFRQDLSEKALNDFRKEVKKELYCSVVLWCDGGVQVEICARLHHPNVLLFMGACTEPGHLAIVTELMPKVLSSIAICI